MKKQVLLIAVALVGVAGATSTSLLRAEPADAGKTAANAAPTLSPDATAATFNGKTIKVAEVDAEIQRKPQFAALQAYSGGDQKILNRIRAAAVNGIINRQLLLTAAKSSGVIDEKEIQSSVEKIVSQYGGKDKLGPLLTNIHTNYENFTSEVADDFRINSFIDKDIAKSLKVSDEDVKKAFDTAPTKYAGKEAITVSHILIKVAPDASAQDDKAAKDKVEEIYAKATAPGGDFAALAKQFSQDGSAPKGGELGLIERGRTVPAFENAAFALKPGEISKPVRSEFGYHLIKVSDKKAAEQPNFAKAKPLIEQELTQKKKAELVEKRLVELRTAANVKVEIPAA